MCCVEEISIYRGPKATSTEKTIISGNLNILKISIAYVEIKNLNMRMSKGVFQE